MEQLPPILALTALFLLVLSLMVLGWRRRARRQEAAGLPAPAPAPPRIEPGPRRELPGVYVATTRAGNHLERITAHGLGQRSRVLISAPEPTGDPHDLDGWVLQREGAPSFLIPAPALQEITTSPGMVGKWMGGDALILLRWDLGGTLLDTGLRLDSRADHDLLLHPANISRKETP